MSEHDSVQPSTQGPAAELPVQHDPAPTVAYAPPEPPVPAKPRNKAVTVLTAVAVVLLLATGTFGALWVMERGDHKTTTGHFKATKTEVESANVKLKDAETKQKDTDTKLQAALAEQKKLETAKQTNDACGNAAKELVKAIEVDDQAKGEAAIVTLAISCR